MLHEYELLSLLYSAKSKFQQEISKIELKYQHRAKQNKNIIFKRLLTLVTTYNAEDCILILEFI